MGDAVCADTSEPPVSASTELCKQSGMRSWPAHQEARGMVLLRLALTGAKSVDALASVHRSALTIHIQSLPGGPFDKKMARIPVGHLVVTLHPGQYELLVFSCLFDDAGEIFCFCKDQAARNKWLYVLRRVEGVTFESRSFPKPLLRPFATLSAGVTPVYTPTPSSIFRHFPAQDRLSRAEEVRAKFLQIQEARGRTSASRRAAQFANMHVYNDPDPLNVPAPIARAESDLSQALTCVDLDHTSGGTNNFSE